MVKLIDILKELNIKSKDSLGQGDEHIVYPSKIKPGFVIKKFTRYDDEFFTKDNWEEIIDTAKQHPDIFAKIDKIDIDKGYFVQEKLDEKSLTKDLYAWDDYVRENNILYRTPADKMNYTGFDILTILYTEPDRVDMLDDTPYEALKPKLENFFDKLEDAGFGVNDNFLGDLRITNVGYDKAGEIKILDFNFDEL